MHPKNSLLTTMLLRGLLSWPLQGGGLCDVDNLRTLCTLCHLEVTKRQAKERAAQRAAGKARWATSLTSLAMQL